jgi:hypothetical protein
LPVGVGLTILFTSAFLRNIAQSFLVQARHGRDLDSYQGYFFSKKTKKLPTGELGLTVEFLFALGRSAKCFAADGSHISLGHAAGCALRRRLKIHSLVPVHTRYYNVA